MAPAAPDPPLPRAGESRGEGRSTATVLVTALALIGSVWGLVAAIHPREGEAPELSFAYADVIRSHAAVARVLTDERDRVGEDPLVVGVWPLTVELRDPVLGFTDRPFRTLHVDHLGDHPEARVDVVVIDPSSRNRDALRALADALGLVTISTIVEDAAPPLEVRARPREAAVPSAP